MLKGTNLEHARVHNLRTVLEMIRLHGPISRAEAARRTDLTPQTVGNLVSELLDRGLVTEVGQRQGSRGRASTELAVNGEGALCIGLDLDRGHLTAVLVDIAGKVHHRIHIDMTFPGPDQAIDLMVDTVETLAKKVERERIWGVGVGFPGPLRVIDGVVDNVINPDGFPGWSHVSVGERLGSRIDFNVYLENNATAAAIGERFYGLGQRLSSFFYLFLGVGLGGGIVQGGQALRGAQGNAGEIGFLPTRPAPHPGAYIGQSFDLFRLYRRLEESGLRISTPAALAPLLADGHPSLLAWLEEAAQQLSTWLLAAEYFLDPEAIVVGGAWPSTMIDHLAKRLEQLLAAQRSALMPYSPPLLRSEVGQDAAALGVATLPLSDLLSPFPTSGELQLRHASGRQHPLAPIGGV